MTPALNFSFVPLLPPPGSAAQVCVRQRADLALSNLLGNWHLCNRSSSAMFSLPELSDYNPSLRAESPPSWGCSWAVKGLIAQPCQSGLSPAEGTFVSKIVKLLIFFWNMLPSLSVPFSLSFPACGC